MANTPKLRIIPLGGVDEIGKNMTVFEYDRDIIVVDCGSMFPKDDMLGIDLVIPDASYLVANKERVRGYVFTHGHEDHIGAVPYVVSQVPAPLYGSRLTLALIENGSWAPSAGKCMKAILEGMKTLNIVEPFISIRSSMKPADEAALEALANRLTEA